MNFIFKNHIYLPTLIVCDRLLFLSDFTFDACDCLRR
jgi:hypothetical protein